MEMEEKDERNEAKTVKLGVPMSKAATRFFHIYCITSDIYCEDLIF